MKPFVKSGLEAGNFGNPSSAHRYGKKAGRAVDRARRQVAELINANPGQVLFTSCGSESNNLALKGTVVAGEEKPHLITSRIEHPSVLQTCDALENRGYEVDYLEVDVTGLVDPNQLRAMIRPETRIVSVMHANNEVGTIQPVAELAEIAHNHGALFHTDAAQSLGKIEVDVDELGVDLLTVAGHKLYAPKGVGALYARDKSELEPLIHGAGHEFGLRAGTENLILDVGLGAACRRARPDEEAPQLEEKRDYFHELLKNKFGDDVVLNGHPHRRLPNTLNISFRGWDANDLLKHTEEIAASTGSACHSDSVELSPVLKALGIDNETGKGAVRFSLGRYTKKTDLEEAAEKLEKVS